MDKRITKFINHVKRQCKKYGIKLVIEDTDECVDEYGLKFCGVFDSGNKLLQVAGKLPSKYFAGLLAHEYGHMRQWIDNPNLYAKSYKNAGDPGIILNEWLTGKEYKKTTIKQCITMIRDCEVDCDKRAIVIMKKYKLPVDIKFYCQIQNAYYYFYNYILHTRTWNYKKGPTEILSIVNKMPDNLDQDYTKLPRHIKHLFDKYLKV